MEYWAYLQTAWEYFPYVFYTFVLLTFLPKSLGRIKAFADADYAASRNRYHRCYAPNACCHDHEQALPKPKPRKAVTRVYPKKQQALAEQNAVVKRPPPAAAAAAAAVLAQNHVNEIARMFESGTASRKVNRVPPTMLPEVRMSAGSFDEQEYAFHNNNNSSSGDNNKRYSLLENIENAANLMNQQPSPPPTTHEELDQNWRSEPIPIPRPMQTRRQRAVPTTLSFSDGTSATPSTGSPAASTDSAAPMEFSPTLRRLPLDMKSSLEDIFAAIARNAESNECGLKFAGCNSLSPVTSIDDILAQRRLSRPLSAYSISDLLNEESNQGMDEAFVENFLRSLNKT